MPQFDTISAFLAWVVYSGGAAMIISWVLEKIPAFQNLSPEAKKFWSTAAAVALAFGVFAVISFVPANTLALIDPWFKILMGIVVVITSMRGYHKLTKK